MYVRVFKTPFSFTLPSLCCLTLTNPCSLAKPSPPLNFHTSKISTIPCYFWDKKKPNRRHLEPLSRRGRRFFFKKRVIPSKMICSFLLWQFPLTPSTAHIRPELPALANTTSQSTQLHVLESTITIKAAQ